MTDERGFDAIDKGSVVEAWLCTKSYKGITA
jgi:hypothetical protein